uniref:Uncharacterized protein n=1 Tax=Siphoviridae sp. ctbrg2 TaxID=2823589 RepID=A0A8S5LG04_9CAUD|nr:MAG TPA: hypothetical protein [Siphoviridae sp. ctbrg2]
MISYHKILKINIKISGARALLQAPDLQHKN